MAGILGQSAYGMHHMCTVDGCFNPAKYRGLGLCSAHRNRIARGKSIDVPIEKRTKTVGQCKVVGCFEVDVAKGLCRSCYQKHWANTYPEKICFQSSKRRASIKNRMPSWLTSDDHWLIKEIYDFAQLRSKIFGFTWHVDHDIPLHGKNVSGLHVPNNLRVIPAMENHKKSSKFCIF